MRKTALIIAALLIAGCGNPDPYDNITTTRFEDGDSFTNCYLIPTGSKARSKLLIVISGSSYVSVLGKLEDDGWAWKGDPWVFLGNELFNRSYDILVPERTNVEPGSDHAGDPRVLATYTVETRCRTMARAIDTFLASPESSPYDEVYLFGQSQGGGLVPRIYDELSEKTRIKKIVITSACLGLSMYDRFLGLRDADNTPPADVKLYRELEEVYERVQSNPGSIDDLWWDDPYKMWHSFFDYLPLPYLRKIDIPILLVHGRDDTTSLIDCSRIAVNEFTKLGKTNLTYLELDGGHFCWVDNLEALASWLEE